MLALGHDHLLVGQQVPVQPAVTEPFVEVRPRPAPRQDHGLVAVQDVVEEGADARERVQDDAPGALDDVGSLARRRDDRIDEEGAHSPEHDLLDGLHDVYLVRRPAMVTTPCNDAKVAPRCGEGTTRDLLTRCLLYTSDAADDLLCVDP